MLQASCAGASLNVRINLGSLTDRAFVDEVSAKNREYSRQVELLTREVLVEVEKSLGG